MAYSVGKNHASMHRFYQKAFNDTSGVLQKWRWVYAKNVEKGLKVPCLFMITEVSIRCQKNPEVGIRRIPANTPLNDTAHTVCRAGYMKVSCVCLSVPSVDRCNSVQWVCCCGPSPRAGDINQLLHRASLADAAVLIHVRSSTPLSSKHEQCHTVG